MAEIELIAGIFGSAFLLLLGYLLNGWRERDLERRKTNYHAKLTHFEGVNESLLHLFESLQLFEQIHLTDIRDPEIWQLVWKLAGIASSVRQEEQVVGTNVAERILSDFKEPTMAEAGEQEPQLRNWVEANYPGLWLTGVRLVTHNKNRLKQLAWNIELVSESQEVFQAVGEMVSLVENRIEEQLLRPKMHGSEKKTLWRSVATELVEANKRFQTAMRNELRRTLRAPLGRLR